MKLQIFKILSPALLVFLFASCTPPAKSVELVRSDKHPEQIIQHYHWCLVGDDLEEETTRLRDFWEDQRPPNGDYEDSIHGRLVLRAAYRLAENYARLGHADEAAKMLDWMRSEDSRLIEEEQNSPEP